MRYPLPTSETTPLDGRPVVVGGGMAGLMTALALAPLPVLVLARAPLGTEASSAWAQGGLAASMGADDAPALHAADTIAAGDGLCDEATVSRFAAAAPDAIAALARLGVRFDRQADGALGLGLEAAHSRNRIVHAGGDGTGREIMRALAAAAARTPSIEVLTGFEARRLIVDDGRIAGVVAAGPAGALTIATGRVVIATGGIGGLFRDSTNPAGSFGQGLALALRAGATIADPEFIQFHPTAFDGAERPMPLVSEAVRGEGARLIDETGHRFMAGIPGGELAPRDVVARAVWRHLAEGHQVFLDARERPGRHFAARFPAITAICRRAGLDPAVDPIPIRPAQHYHMGGIAVDAAGRSTVEGLWAAGEAAATGLHGANRLASNSLTEAAVGAAAVAASLAASPATSRPLRPAGLPPAPDPSAVRPILSRAAGVLRDRHGLERAVADLGALATGRSPAADPALVGLTIAVAALAREESRGGHSRTDFPDRQAVARRSCWTIDGVMAAAAPFLPASRKFG